MKRSVLLPLLLASVTASAAEPIRPAVPKEEPRRAESGAWDGFVKRFIEETFKAEPTFAVYQGRHEYDGRLPDWSEAGIGRTIAGLKKAREDARRFDEKRLTAAQRFERAQLLALVEGQLFWLEDADQPHKNPAYYLDRIFPSIYATRPYAPPETRMRAFVAWAKAVPTATAQIRANLKQPMALPLLDYGQKNFAGLATYLRGPDAPAPFAGVKDAALQAEFKAEVAKAAEAADSLAKWLESNRAIATGDFRLGGERFARMLKATEMVDTPLAELERIGRADLARNQAAVKAECAKFAPGQTIEQCFDKLNANKPEGGAVAGARAQLGGLKQFILDKQIVTIPGTEEIKVDEAPPYNRQNFAYIEIPGPYEKGLPSVYYIAPPDPSWSKAVQDAFVPGKADLLFTSVHEVWPGHFLQFLHANRVKSLFARIFVGYAYAEGYAHYAEEMMWDAGLGEGSPETHIGQLSNALLRDCRYLSALGMHQGRMTQEESFELFRTECYQDEGNSRQQAARGTYDPAYLNYTLGKLLIRRLRDDWVKSRGGRQAWTGFHDQFLSFGGPPIPLVRGAMLGEAPKAAF